MFCCGRKSLPSDTALPVHESISLEEMISVKSSYSSYQSCDSHLGDATNSSSILVTGRTKMTLFESIIEDNSNLTKNGKNKNINLYFKKCQNDDPMFVYGYTDFPTGDINRINSIINDIANKTKWDDNMESGQELFKIKINENESIGKCYSSSKAKSGVSGRDFVYHTYHHVTNERAVTCAWSDEGCRLESVSAKHVRGMVLLGGYLVQKDNDNSCTVHFFNQVDMGGFIPTWLLDPILKKTPMILNALMRVVLEKN
jgi:hypothetical protein